MTMRTSNYFPSLTGLRAIAAGLVLFFHYWEAARVFQGTSLPLITWLMGNGQNGVTIFFVLSGFLITIRYRPGFARGQVPFRTYWLKRFIRIYPVYFFVLTVLVILPETLSGNQVYQNPWVLLGLLGLAQGLFISLFPLGVPIGWTLTLEEIYYVVAPRMASWLDRNPTQASAAKRMASPIVLGLLLAGLAALVFAMTLAFPILTQFTGYHTEFLYSVSFFIRVPEFIAGTVAGLLYLNHRARIQPHASGLVWVGVLAGIVTLQAANHFFLASNFPVYVLFQFLGGVSAATFMLGVGCGGANLVSRWLGSPVLEYLGKTSYALYLVHLTWPMQKLYAALLQWPIQPVAVAPLMYVASVLLSIVLYELIERPAHQWLSTKLARPATDNTLVQSQAQP